LLNKKKCRAKNRAQKKKPLGRLWNNILLIITNQNVKVARARFVGVPIPFPLRIALSIRGAIVSHWMGGGLQPPSICLILIFFSGNDRLTLKLRIIHINNRKMDYIIRVMSLYSPQSR